MNDNTTAPLPDEGETETTTIPLPDDKSQTIDLTVIVNRLSELESVVARRGYDTRPIYEKHEKEIEVLWQRITQLETLLAKNGIELEVEESNLDLNENAQSEDLKLPMLNGSPVDLFGRRTASAFPGVRGFQWFDNPQESVKRLAILLQKPLTYDLKSGGYEHPIWWWRGNSSSQVTEFDVLSDNKCLLDIQELIISRIGVYRSTSHYRDFVYVEVSPDKPTGQYAFTDEDYKRQIDMFGYASEEYGLFEDQIISRREYDDGAAVIDGEIVETVGRQKLRLRYLSKYNFIIAAHDSPINMTELDDTFEKLLNRMLENDQEMELIIEIVEKLRKPKYREW